MKNNEILNEANEALKRTLLMMNYDMKKTLTENVEVISEQTNDDQEIANLLWAGAHSSPGTKVDKLVSGFSKIKDAEQYKRVEKIYANSGKEKTLQDMLRAELGSGDGDDLKKIKDSLSKAGVELTYTDTVNYNFGVPSSDVDSDTISVKFGVTPPTNSSKTSSTLSSSLDNLKKLTNGEDSNINKIPSLKVKYPNSIIQYANNGRYFQYGVDGKSLVQKGGWKIENGKIVKIQDGSNKKEVVGDKNKKSVPAITDKTLLDTLNFEYTFPGDKTYVYDFVPSTTMTEQTNNSGTWYAKNVKTGKVFDISKHFPQTEKKLNDRFPSAANFIDKSPKNLNTTGGEKSTMDDVSQLKSKGLEATPVGADLSKIKKIELPSKTKSTSTPEKEDMSKLDIYGPATENLKKSLKKNLMEVKENKENIMVETNIVEKRFKFIVEGKTFETEKDQDFLIESVISEIGYLKAQGYTPKAINEGLFSMLGSLLGGAATSAPAVFGEYIASWLTKQLGIPQNSYMNGVIVSLVGNLNIADYDRFFSDCRFASNKIADSLIEGYLLQLQNEKNANSGASGFIVSALRNSVVDYFAEDKNSLIQILEDKIGEFICPKLSKLSSVIGDKADDIKAKAVA